MKLLKIASIILFINIIIAFPFASFSLDQSELANTIWSGKNSDGSILKYVFLKDGDFQLIDQDGFTYDGFWVVRENSIAMELFGVQGEFRGKLVNNELSGNANIGISTWEWQATKFKEEQDKVNLSDSPKPRTPPLLVPYYIDAKFNKIPSVNIESSNLRPIHGSIRYKPFSKIIYSYDGSTQVSYDDSKYPSHYTTFFIYDALSNKRQITIRGGQSFALSPDGKLFSAIDYNPVSSRIESSIVIYDVLSSKQLKELDIYSNCVAFSPDGKYLSTGDKLIDFTNGTIVREFKRTSGSLVMSQTFSPDSRLLFVGKYKSNEIDVYDVATGKLIEQLNAPSSENEVSFLAFSKDDKVIVSGSNDRLENFWEYSPRGFFSSEYPQLHEYKRKYAAFLVNTSNIESKLKTEMQQVLQARVAGMNLPRGEFEKSSEYNSRIQKARKLEQDIESEYAQKIKDALAIAEQEKAEWQKLLSNSLYPATIDILLGSYDPDNETFSAVLTENKILIPVPRDKAVKLSTLKNKVRIEGKVRYYNDTHVELVNTYLSEDSTGTRIAFGNHLEPVLLATTENTPPQLIISALSIIEPSGNGILDAGEKGKIRAVLKNSSKGTAFGVVAKFQLEPATPGISIDGQKYLGIIKGSEEKTIEADILAAEDIDTTDIRIKALGIETNGFDAKPVILSFKSKALVPPILQIASVDIKSSDSKHTLSKGVQADLNVRVQNAGNGLARGVIVDLNTNSREIVTYGESSIKLGDLAPGDTKEVIFSIAVNQRYQGSNTLPVSFVVKEDRPRFTVKPAVSLALNEEVSDIRVVKVEARDTIPPKIIAVDDISVVPTLKVVDMAFGENDVALVVGIERYQSFSEAKFAVNDAKLVEKYLMALGIPRRNIQLVTDEKATRGGIEKSLESWLPNRVKPNSRVFVYYSGHGTPDPVSGEPYIFPHDGDPSYLSSTSYPLKRLYASLAKLNVRDVIVVIDSCFSGSGERSVLAMGARPAIVKIDDPVLRSDRMVVLTSTEGTQISTSLQDKKHGVFTYYFLKSIKEGKKNLGDIYTDIKPKIEDEAKRLNVNQSPALKPGIDQVFGKYSMRK